MSQCCARATNVPVGSILRELTICLVQIEIRRPRRSNYASLHVDPIDLLTMFFSEWTCIYATFNEMYHDITVDRDRTISLSTPPSAKGIFDKKKTKLQPNELTSTFVSSLNLVH
jgi:hypothetical protein